MKIGHVLRRDMWYDITYISRVFFLAITAVIDKNLIESLKLIIFYEIFWRRVFFNPSSEKNIVIKKIMKKK